jgi:hypothetical protein
VRTSVIFSLGLRKGELLVSTALAKAGSEKAENDPNAEKPAPFSIDLLEI